MSITVPYSHLALSSMVFGAADLSVTDSLPALGLLKHIHIVVPNFTNVVTARVEIIDYASRVLWASAEKARNASYNLEKDAEWLDQVIGGGLSIKVTLSGVAGGTGGTVVAELRSLGA